MNVDCVTHFRKFSFFALSLTMPKHIGSNMCATNLCDVYTGAQIFHARSICTWTCIHIYVWIQHCESLSRTLPNREDAVFALKNLDPKLKRQKWRAKRFNTVFNVVRGRRREYFRRIRSKQVAACETSSSIYSYISSEYKLLWFRDEIQMKNVSISNVKVE